MSGKRVLSGIIWGASVLLVVGAASAVGVVPRLRQRAALDHMQAAILAPQLVRTAAVKAAPDHSEITLPGTVAPFQSTALYAKATGFLRQNLVDVGDPVKAGQLMAEIDAPETDEDLRLARVRLDEAAANVGIVQRNAQRNGQLVGVGVVSQQQADDSTAQANSALASLRTRQAELQRVSAVHGYQRVIAPFDGIVTRRGFDRGALVGAAGGGGAALFEVAQIDKLRVFVDVPQSLARDIRPGVATAVYSPSEPQRSASGQVVRTSGVLEQATRTLHTEAQIPGDGTLLPGAFVYVRFRVSRTTAPPLVPANALIVRKEGTLLARIVQGAGQAPDQGSIALMRVQISRDLGKDLEVASGIQVGDKVVLNPPDDLSDGMLVRLADSTPPESLHAQAAGSKSDSSANRQPGSK